MQNKTLEKGPSYKDRVLEICVSQPFRLNLLINENPVHCISFCYLLKETMTEAGTTKWKSALYIRNNFNATISLKLPLIFLKSCTNSEYGSHMKTVHWCKRGHVLAYMCVNLTGGDNENGLLKEETGRERGGEEGGGGKRKRRKRKKRKVRENNV